MQPPIDPRPPHEPVVDTSPITLAVRTLTAGGAR